MTVLAERFSDPLDVDAYRTLVDPLWTDEARGVIESVRPLTPTSVAIRIATNRAWPGHAPGQFVTIGVEIDGVRHHRCYSLTSPPGLAARPTLGRRGGDIIEIAVQRVEGGMVSTHLTTAARPGDVVHLSAPAGDFTLPAFTPDRLLLISGGSGITPMMGLLRSLAARPPHTDVVVVHHAPSRERTMFAVELSLLAATHDWLTVHVVHTREGGAHLDGERLARLCPDWRDRESYVCGPAPLLDVATDLWATEQALPRLHLERFTTDVGPRVGAGSSASRDGGSSADRAVATFAASGVAADADVDATLLETAEAAGVLAPFGCRTGVCHTCSTRLLAGCTTDRRDGRTSGPGAHVQLCVSRPVGDVTLDL